MKKPNCIECGEVCEKMAIATSRGYVCSEHIPKKEPSVKALADAIFLNDA